MLPTRHALTSNGYSATHNSKYSKPLTGNPEADAIWSRDKRIYNDEKGIRAARNVQQFLIQTIQLLQERPSTIYPCQFLYMVTTGALRVDLNPTTMLKD